MGLSDFTAFQLAVLAKTGATTWAGPAVGALFITVLLFMSAGSNPVAGKAAVGVILIVVILFMPNGVLGYFLKRRAAVRGAAPADPVAALPLVHAHAPAPAPAGPG